MATKIHHVPLSGLPTDVQVPDELNERFWYDADGKRLCFNGFMSKYTFDRLEELSRDGPYQRAIEDLFRICVLEDDASSSTRSMLKAILIAILGITAVSGLVTGLLLAR